MLSGLPPHLATTRHVARVPHIAQRDAWQYSARATIGSADEIRVLALRPSKKEEEHKLFQFFLAPGMVQSVTLLDKEFQIVSTMCVPATLTIDQLPFRSRTL